MLDDYLLIFTQPVLLLLTAVGTLAGIYVGAVPGLSGTMAVSLLASFTYGWSAQSAVALMIGVFVGAVFGGSRSAILLNIPGAPAAVATAFDGYPLAKKGLAGPAMGAATVQSFIGTLLGIAALVLFAPLLAKPALSFKTTDYLILACIAMPAAGSIGTGRASFAKSAVTAALGVFLGTVGMDPMTAVRRFTFSSSYLNSGIDFVVALIGLFGASEAFLQLIRPGAASVRQSAGKILPSLRDTIRRLPLTLRSAAIGIFVGAIPGAGGDIAALLAYDSARRTVRKPPTPFGEGALEGVIAPETANNAAIGGAFIPMLTLGIPGDSVTAVLISALMVHGISPGPNFMSASPDIFALIVSCLAVSAVFMLFFGLSGIKVFTKLTEIPREILMPMVLVLCVIGAWAIRSNFSDVLWMFFFGALGCLFKSFGYPIAPMVLGIILCPLLENNFRRGVALNGSVVGLLRAAVVSPVFIAVIAVAALLLAVRIYRRLTRRNS